MAEYAMTVLLRSEQVPSFPRCPRILLQIHALQNLSLPDRPPPQPTLSIQPHPPPQPILPLQQ